jgi:hypothetical protein
MRKTSPQIPALAVALALVMPGTALASDRELGSCVRHNIAVQTIDPDPRYAGTLMEGGVGQRSAAAVRRYMTGNIKSLARVDGRTQVGQQGGAVAESNRQ